MKEQKKKKLLGSKKFRRFVALFAVFAMVLSLFPNVAKKVSAQGQGYKFIVNLYDYEQQNLMTPEYPVEGPFFFIAVAEAIRPNGAHLTCYAVKKVDKLTADTTTVEMYASDFRYDEWDPDTDEFTKNNYNWSGHYDQNEGYTITSATTRLYVAKQGVDPSTIEEGSPWGAQHPLRYYIGENDDTGLLTDQIPPTGYKYFGTTTTNDKCEINLYRTEYHHEYQLKVELDGEGGAISADDGYYAIVEVEHHSPDRFTYFISDALSSEGGNTELKYSVSKWLDSNGHELNNEVFTGHEYGRKVYLIKLNDPDNKPSTADLLKMQPSQVTVISETSNVGGYIYSGYEADTEKNDTTHVQTFFDKVKLTAPVLDTDYNFLDVLGDAVNYGVVSEEIHIDGHSETNFATNDYSGNKNFDPDLSGDAEGNQVPGNFLISNIQDGSEVLFGGETPATAYVMVPDGQNDRVNSNACKDNVVVTGTDAGEISAMVDSMITHMQNVSANMIDKETFKPVMVGNKLNIDTTSFPDNAVIYLDGDNYLEAIQTAANGKGNNNPTQGVNIKKHPGQLIVFNFNSTTDVNIGTIAVDWGEGYWTSNTKNGVYNDPEELNVHADLVSRQVVWNLASATKVTLKEAGGIYLLPRTDAYINAGGTSCGWIVNAGHSELGEGGEFHFVYRGLSQNNVASLSLEKTVDGKTPAAAEKFDFTVETYDYTDHKFVKEMVSDGQGGETEYLIQNNGRKINVKLTNLREGANIVRIAEKAKAGYKANDQVFYASFNVKVVKTGTIDIMIPSGITYYTDCDEATGVLSNKISNTPVFKNETKGGTFTVTKEVTGDVPAIAATFTVELTGVLADDTTALTGEYAVEGLTGTDKITFTDGKATFGIKDGDEVVISDLPAGTKITVAEKNIPDGYVLKTTDLTGTVVATGTPAKVELENEYTEDEITTNITISKQSVAGTEIKGATLTLTGKAEGTETPIEFDINNIQVGTDGTLKSTANGTTLEWISGSEETLINNLPNGTYTLKETDVPGGYEQAEEITFVIKNGKVFDADNKEIDANKIVMLDEYSPVEVELEAEKVFKNEDNTAADLTAGQFEFKLNGINAAAGTSQTKTNAADGSVKFDKLSFTSAGTYRYKISETKGNDEEHITYSTDVYDVTITVAEGVNGVGGLTADVEIKKGNTVVADAVFTNIKKDEEQKYGNLKIKKSFDGANVTKEEAEGALQFQVTTVISGVKYYVTKDGELTTDETTLTLQDGFVYDSEAKTFTKTFPEGKLPVGEYTVTETNTT
ncbi:pilin isopeptide linkage domain-containing protein, partial [Eubacterium ruminantium]